jgi:predicted kinase
MWTLSENKDWSFLEGQFHWARQMRDVPQDPVHHAEGNVSIHTQMVLDALQQQAAFLQLPAQAREILWAAALLHDVEKYSTTVTESDGRVTAKGHARKGALRTRQLLYREVPTPFAIREQVVALVRYHGLPLWIFDKKEPLKEAVRAALEVNLQWLALLARADALARICADRQDLLYRIDCFEELCRENGCWGSPRSFANPHARMHYFEREGAYIDYTPFELPAFEVVLMSGLPGAGKDSYIRRHLKELPVISLDMLREEMDVDATDKTGNGQVIQAAKESARSYLRKREGFVWNATNTTRQMRTQLIELFTTYKAGVKIIYVEVPYADLFSQNRNREEVVPANVLEKLIDKLEVPAPWEAHQVEFCVR